MTYRDLSADYAFGVEEAYLLTVSETVITAPAGSVAEIPPGRGLRIAEVYGGHSVVL